MLEIDTRAAADGRIFVHHNPRPSRPFTHKRWIAETDSRALRRAHYPDGEGMMELAECLSLFARLAPPDQRLCIDMKDFGFEREHVEMVQRLGLDGRVSWMSWVPRSLELLRELGSTGPLILGLCNLSRFGLLGAAVTAGLHRAHFRLARVVVRGAGHELRAPGRFTHGYQHGFVCSRLPAPIEALLARSGGGVCVHWALLSRALFRYCDESGLGLCVFKVRSVAAFRRYAANPVVSAVFSDDAAAVLREAGAGTAWAAHPRRAPELGVSATPAPST